MSKYASAKYYQDSVLTKKDYKKMAHERYQSLSKEEKEKKHKIVVNDVKISREIKNKGYLSIRKIFQNEIKHITIISIAWSIKHL